LYELTYYWIFDPISRARTAFRMSQNLGESSADDDNDKNDKVKVNVNVDLYSALS